MPFTIARTATLPIGLDPGAGEVRLAQLRRGAGGVDLVAAGSALIPGSCREDLGRCLEAMESSIHQTLRSYPFKGRQCILCLPAESTFVRHMKVPKLPPEMTEQYVTAEVQGMLPPGGGPMVVRHAVAGEVAAEGQDQREVIVVAAPQEVLEAYLAMTRRVKLEVIGVTTDAFAVVECFGHLLRRSAESGRTIFFVDLGATCTKAALSHGGDVVFARNLSVGGRDLDQAVAAGKGVSLSEAGALRLGLAEPGEAADPTLPRLLDPKIDEIASGLSQCLAYHASVFKNQDAELVVFVGAEARDRHLCQAIARRLDLPAKIGDPFTCIDGQSASVNGTDVDPDVPHPDWAVAVGLSLCGQ